MKKVLRFMSFPLASFLSASLLLMMGTGFEAFAGDGLVDGVRTGGWEESLRERQEVEEARAVKSRLILEIMSQRQELDGRAYDESWASVMEAALEGLTPAELERAQDLLAGGEALPEGLIGEVDQDLVFTPLDAPCRFYDSRNTAEGALVPEGEDRALVVAGGSIPPEQGAASFCNVQDSAVAVVINVLAVDPQGRGNFQMWPSDGSPGDSVINYGGPSLRINLINGIMVPICNRFRGPCPTDLMLRTNFSESHAVVNVTGFFSPPPPTPLDCETVSSFENVPGQTAFSFASVCPAGFSLTGSGYSLSPSGADIAIESLIPGLTQVLCSGGNFGGVTGQVTCFARCCRIPGR